TTGAPRISPTHFMDSDGKVSGNVAPRRYFCLQCHVPQSDTAPWHCRQRLVLVVTW
ncbi:nitrate reductase cytochrome c-type subunit, partial [Salmonella enterica subsp. enterica serovar Montevideo]|nr:nitrate reductase cytochrome c-type subunit [Salmonella enterica subsp. enterica serovar Montevideo]